MIAVYLAMLETDVDRDKFMKLYESYEKKLFAVALRILENNEKAEDAVQQAWLRIIQHWERVSCLEWDLAGGYAVTTVKNAAIDILRQEKRVEPLPATWDPPAREESQDEYQYLVSLIQTLPDTYRRILELKYVEEYSNREIAKRLKMNEARNTLASHTIYKFSKICSANPYSRFQRSAARTVPSPGTCSFQITQ